MPIYEFYCSDCHMLFNFLSSSIDTSTRPSCPRCERPDLERRPARFATLSGAAKGEADADDPFAHLDDAKLDGAMESMMSEMGDLEGDEDPRKLAGALRRLGEATGLELGPRMEEMLGRLEAGEDPDRLEEEMTGDEEGDESVEEFFRIKKRSWKRRRRPRVDDTLYFL